MNSVHDDEDDEIEVPLQHRRPFGSGLKRKTIAFVPASSGSRDKPEDGIPTKPSSSVADRYLSLVLPPASGSSDTPQSSEPTSLQLCTVCSLPVSQSSGATIDDEDTTVRPHEASIAHQVCLDHSHPPSAIDRSRMGLAVLQSQGWDPDARTGLGAGQQGVTYPLKTVPKDNNLGIGVVVPRHLPPKKEKVQKLDAKRARKAALEDKRRLEKLRQQFYSSSDVDKYLGTG